MATTNFAPTSTPQSNSKICRYPLHKATPRLKPSSPKVTLIQHATALTNELSDIIYDLDTISGNLFNLADEHVEIETQLENLHKREHTGWTENRKRLVDANNRASKLQNKFLSPINGVLYTLYDCNSGKKIDMFPGRVECIEWMSDQSIISILNSLGEDLPTDLTTLKDCFKKAIGILL